MSNRIVVNNGIKYFHKKMCLTLVCHVSFHATTFRCRVFSVENQTCDTKCVQLIFSLSQGSVAENIHRRTFTSHTFCLPRSLLPNTVISSDTIPSRHSLYFLRLMRFPILVDMHGNLHERLTRAAPLQSKDSIYPWTFFPQSFRYY